MSVQPAAGGASNDALIASDIAGRLRVRLRRDVRSPETFARLSEALLERDGVDGVDTNEQAGSVTVRYDEARCSRDQILAVFRDVGIVIGTGAEAHRRRHAPRGRSGVSDDIVGMVDIVDGRLSRLTGRRVDLRLVLPITLAAIGIWRVANSGLGIAQMPAFTLLWYAFDSFYKLNVQAQLRGMDE